MATSSRTNKPAPKASKSAAATAPPVAASSTPTPPVSSAPSAAAASTLPAPPPIASIPVPPSGTDAPGGANYRSVIPRKIELAALPGAVADLVRCTDFAQIFGATGLPYAQVLQTFERANQWSTMRKQTAAWDVYAQTQEGICWGALRGIMNTLKPAFEVASAGDPSLTTTLPNFATLFHSKKMIAQKGVSTKRLNKAAIAKGEAPVHGGVGKRRQRAAEKAALLAAKETSSSPAGATSGAGSAPTPAPSPAKGNPTQTESGAVPPGAASNNPAQSS